MFQALMKRCVWRSMESDERSYEALEDTGHLKAELL